MLLRSDYRFRGGASGSPNAPNVKFHSMIMVRLGNNGEIGNVINNTGGVTAGYPRVTPKSKLARSYQNSKRTDSCVLACAVPKLEKSPTTPVNLPQAAVLFKL